MHIFIIVAALLVAIAPAHDADSRELYTHAKSDPTILATPGAARGTCCTLSSPLQIHNFVLGINYVPADSSLYFLGAVCQPGDYQGKNYQTEARASCSFTADGHALVIESAAIAQKVNATLA
jgi:hypothetical protein